MPPEAQTVLHTWCRQSDWNAPTIVGGAGARLLTADGRSILDMRKSGFEGGRVYFTLGGADANEHAVKFSRQAGRKPHGWVITRERSYHGASYGAMALSGDARTADQVNPTAHRVAARGNLILLAPPLVIGEHDLADALDLLDRLLGSLAQAIRTGKQP
jgi:taurine--2-oxoglutarate transaminase